MLGKMYNNLCKVINSKAFKSLVLQHDVQKYLQIKSRNYIMTGINKPFSEAVQMVEEALLYNNYIKISPFHKLPKTYLKDISKLMVMRYKNYHIDVDMYENIVEQTNSFNPLLLSSKEWKFMSSQYSRHGLLYLGNLIRDKAIFCAYHKKEDKGARKNDYIEAYKAALDQSDFEMAQQMLSKLRDKSYDKQEMDDFLLYYSLLSGDKESAQILAQKAYSDIDLEYYNYLKGKSVAVVGPAPSHEDLGKEIDSFDVIIRLNYQGSDYLPSQIEFGEKINVSYYNSAQIKKKAQYEYYDDLDFIVFKSRQTADRRSIEESYKNRWIITPDKYLFNGSLTMIQLTLFDLIHYDPKEIKLFKTNFFLSRNTHHRGYNADYLDPSSERIRRWNSFAGHDLLTQINFTKTLKNGSYLDVDKTCETILNMPPSKYLQMMEKVFSTMS